MSILRDAESIVYNDREKTYGDPGANCRRIAGIWTQILGVDVTEEQVCLCMMGVKLARLANNAYHQDSLVDICGYATVLERVIESKKGGFNGEATDTSS